MALLTHIRTGRSLALPNQALVGRNPACAVHARQDTVSSEHARLRWSESRWWIRDLGSSNGTYVDGAQLTAGAETPLKTGSQLAFGSPMDLWVLEDAGPPGLFLRNLDTGAQLRATAGVLLAPDDASPDLCIIESTPGEWTLDDHDRTPCVHGDILTAGGERWQVCAPNALPPTARAAQSDVHVSFRVSRDEEHVQMTLAAEGPLATLPFRSYSYLLLTLARARVADASLPSDARGWVDRDTLADQLRVATSTINVQLYRARRDLASVRSDLASGLVERRARTSLIRWGTDRVDITVV